MPRNPHAKPRPLTDQEYADLLDRQGGECAIATCHATPKSRRLDHDHSHRTGATRGLLCHRHNRRLWVGASSNELRAMADYLEASGE